MLRLTSKDTVGTFAPAVPSAWRLCRCLTPSLLDHSLPTLQVFKHCSSTKTSLIYVKWNFSDPLLHPHSTFSSLGHLIALSFMLQSLACGRHVHPVHLEHASFVHSFIDGKALGAEPCLTHLRISFRTSLLIVATQ